MRCLITYSAPSHYLNKRWLIVKWTLWNKFLWNLNWNFPPFSFNKIHLKMLSAKKADILSQEDELMCDSYMEKLTARILLLVSLKFKYTEWVYTTISLLLEAWWLHKSAPLKLLLIIISFVLKIILHHLRQWEKNASLIIKTPSLHCSFLIWNNSIILSEFYCHIL